MAAYYRNEKEKWYEKNQIIADYPNKSVDSYNSMSREKYWADKNNLSPKQIEVGDVVVFQESYLVGENVKYQNGSVVKVHKCSKEYDEGLNFDYLLCVDAYGDEFRIIDHTCNARYTDMLKTKAEEALNIKSGFGRKKKWTEYYKLKEKFANIKFNYASTIHKLQGSTYETVFIDIGKMMHLFRLSEKIDTEFFYRLLYVAVTRASENIVILK